MAGISNFAIEKLINEDDDDLKTNFVGEIPSKEQIFRFDSYDFVGLKEFIIDNDRKLIDKFFHGLSKMNKKGSAINLTYVEFTPPAYEKK